MSGRSFSVTTNSTYEYVGKNTGSMVASDIPDITERLMGNILDFESVFSSGDFLYQELNQIKHELIYTARYFGQQQGFSLSGNLLTHIDAEVNTNKILFFNNATNERGQYYAGHIEYGHYARDKKTFVEARPFMRPALYAVSKASTGNFAETLSSLLGDIFKDNGRGYQGISNLNFGKKLGSYTGYGRPEFRTLKGLNKATERKRSRAVSPKTFNGRVMGKNLSLKTLGDNSALHKRSLLDVGFKHTTGRVMSKSEKYRRLSKLSEEKSTKKQSKTKRQTKIKKQSTTKKQSKTKQSEKKTKQPKKKTKQPKKKTKQSKKKTKPQKQRKRSGYRPPKKNRWIYDPKRGFIEVPK